MILLHISDTSVEAIQTAKGFLGKSPIVSAGKRELTAGCIEKGLIKDKEQLRQTLLELFSVAYPKAIKDTEVGLVISDQLGMSRRIGIENSKSKQLSAYILEEAKKILPEDPANYEHFYRVLSDDKGKSQVLYTVMPLSVIALYASFIESLNLKLKFLTYSSFSIFELIKPIITAGSTLLYCHIDGYIADYYLHDAYSPVLYLSKKFSHETLSRDIEKIIADNKENGVSISHILFGGGSPEAENIQELSHDGQLSIVKMADIVDGLLQRHKIPFNSGGTPKDSFSFVLGGLLLTKASAPANFATDIPTILARIKTPVVEKSSPKQNEELKEEQVPPMEPVKPEEQPETAKENAEVVTTDFVPPQLPMEMASTNRFSIQSVIKNKIWIFIGFICGGVLAMLFFSLVSIKTGGRLTFPFRAIPTVTPTLTPEPTLTPTPTIDVHLKRSDLNLQIQNGTDTTGLAKQTATALSAKGYKGIATSNSEKNFDKTVIQIKKSKQNYLPIIVGDLKDKFDTSTIETLDDKSSYDAIIILGSK